MYVCMWMDGWMDAYAYVCMYNIYICRDRERVCVCACVCVCNDILLLYIYVYIEYTHSHYVWQMPIPAFVLGVCVPDVGVV